MEKDKAQKSKANNKDFFYTYKDFLDLRIRITQEILNDFYFTEKKYLKELNKYFGNKPIENYTDEEIERRKELIKKYKSYTSWFIPFQRKNITEILIKIGVELRVGNAIMPYRIKECDERRLHQDRAIGLLEALKGELQFTYEYLPVNCEKFNKFAEEIDKLIAKTKNWRTSDNYRISNCLKNHINLVAKVKEDLKNE